MRAAELQVGDWYVVAGSGPMHLVQLPDPPTSVLYRFQGPRSRVVEVELFSIIGRVDREFFDMFKKNRKNDRLNPLWMSSLQQWVYERAAGKRES